VNEPRFGDRQAVSPTGTRALVTGASGFIGSRLLERLTDTGVRARALIRDGLLAHRTSSPACEFVRGDVTEPASLTTALADCQVVFHCAWGGSSLEDARRINVQGTRNLIEAAAQAGVRRVVHLSSMAVHGPHLPEVLTEEHPLVFSGDAYSVSKAEGEVAAFERGRALGVEVVALRPTLVYGPRSRIWLLDYVDRVKHGHLALIDGGRGLANLVYVDDLVDAMSAAAEKAGVAGEAFLISGAQPVTWREYIGQFAAMCRKPLPRSVPLWRARLEVQWLRVHWALTRHPRQLQGMDLSLMAQRTAVSIEKARRLLAYAARTSLDEGMRHCEVWLRREGHLPPAAASDLPGVPRHEARGRSATR
jgi:nucleoside-diphosphate-sugar epimerase